MSKLSVDEYRRQVLAVLNGIATHLGVKADEAIEDVVSSRPGSVGCGIPNIITTGFGNAAESSPATLQQPAEIKAPPPPSNSVLDPTTTTIPATPDGSKPAPPSFMPQTAVTPEATAPVASQQGDMKALTVELQALCGQYIGSDIPKANHIASALSDSYNVTSVFSLTYEQMLEFKTYLQSIIAQG